jgi:DNA-binding CsgD family transcriptional regulator
VAGFQSSETLTRREQQTALLAAASHSDSAIAVELEISVRTVQNHLARVYRKLGVSNRGELPDALASSAVDATITESTGIRSRSHVTGRSTS